MERDSGRESERDGQRKRWGESDEKSEAEREKWRDSVRRKEGVKERMAEIVRSDLDKEIGEK